MNRRGLGAIVANAVRSNGEAERPDGTPEPDQPADDVVRSTARTLWVALPDSAGTVDDLVRDRDAHVDAAFRGVRTHLLCRSELVDDPQAVREMRVRANAGIRVRLHDRIPRPVTIADQSLALTCGPTVLTGRARVQGLVEMFRALWRDSRSAGFDDRPHAVPGQEEPVLYALRSGLTDEVAARHLQVSVRTYRREVAKIMRRLGAKSRFEAGFRAALLGPGSAAPGPDGPLRPVVELP